MENKAKKDMKRLDYQLSEINAVYHEAAQKLGLSDSAMMILYTVCEYEGSCLVSDIYHLSGIAKQTINSALRKLEHEQMIYLERFDGRNKKVCLTEKGKTAAQRTVCRIIAMENAVFDGWTDEERQLYLDLTQRFLDEIREQFAQL